MCGRVVEAGLLYTLTHAVTVAACSGWAVMHCQLVIHDRASIACSYISVLFLSNYD
jgi:hypothetical protein